MFHGGGNSPDPFVIGCWIMFALFLIFEAIVWLPVIL